MRLFVSFRSRLTIAPRYEGASPINQCRTMAGIDDACAKQAARVSYLLSQNTITTEITMRRSRRRLWRGGKKKLSEEDNAVLSRGSVASLPVASLVLRIVTKIN